MENNGGLPLLRIRDKDVYLASFHTQVAAVAFLGIEDDRSAWCSDVGKGVDRFLCHKILLLPLALDL